MSETTAETMTTYGYPLSKLSSIAKEAAMGVWDPFGFSAVSVFAVKPAERTAREDVHRAWSAAHPGAVDADWWAAIDEEAERAKARALEAAQAEWMQRAINRRAAFPTLAHDRGMPLRYVKAWSMGRGDWTPRAIRSPGERVTHAGRIWLCVAPTPDEPAESNAAWVRARAQEAARDVLQQLERAPMDRRRPLLLLLGGVGTGKTAGAVVACIDAMLASANAADAKPLTATDPTRTPWGGLTHASPHSVNLARGSIDVVYWSARERSRAGVYGEEASAEIARAKNADVLVIDEVGGEFARESGPWVSVLEEVISHRYDEAYVTILTANIDAASVTGRLGERIADRIREAGRVVQCGEKSVRRAVGAGCES